jgi:hypothetical protein
MRLIEFVLSEMSEEEFVVYSRQSVDQFVAEKIELIFTTHVKLQVAFNQDPRRAALVSPKAFTETFGGILKAWKSGKLTKFLEGLNKRPEVYILFKRKFTTPEKRPGVANVPCVILKNTPPFEYKIKALTFMVKDHYMNADFPQDSVMWV